MSTIDSKAYGVDCIAEGHILRWIKQLALRGRARTYDEHGVCGRQRLVVAGDLKRFKLHVSRLFPAAKITTTDDEKGTWTLRLLEILGTTKEQVLTTKELSRLLGKEWRSISPDVMTTEFESELEGLGWKYVRVKGRVGKGRLGTRFERLGQAQAGLRLAQAA
jgi:hypothetical protein